MHKTILSSLLCICFLINHCFSQSVVHTINGHTFEFITNLPDNIDDRMHDHNYVVSLKRNGKELLEHAMYQHFSDCSGLSVELGTYKVDGNFISFYSYWASANRQNHHYYGFGFRKQVYEVKANGKVEMANANIYLEDIVFNAFDEHASEYLLNHFADVEEEYNADFVLGRRKARLEKEVRKVLAKEIKKYTGGWDKEYPGQHSK